MAFIGNLLKKGIRIRESIEQEYSNPFDLQKNELKKLMIHARHTAFGKYYGFKHILKQFKSEDPRSFYTLYRDSVPVFNYNKIYDAWWHRTRDGESDIAWPGKIKYYALSSGTSGASSKYLPVTKDMLRAIRKTSLRQILTLSKYDLPDNLFEKGILMLGGSTQLRDMGGYFEGDLSGITTGQIPIWFQRFYKPGQKIARVRDWNEKIREIVKIAPKWDIGILAGNPAWIQMLIEQIIEHYNVKNIHEVWPNLTIFTFGGVSFEPYRKGFETLLARPLVYIETYLASEGYVAFESRPNARCMRMVLNNGLFYEFVPFNDKNFDEDGVMVDQPETRMIDEVEEGVEYALLISTCSGAWRYEIGDVIKFVNKEESEIIITGRTKHFLSLCGEHLSVDNMNQAIGMVMEELNIVIKEFTVAGVPYGSLFAHQWYIGCDDEADPKLILDRLDHYLKELNDDYTTERTSALPEVFLEKLPTEYFMGWMESSGHYGGQAKFPRVLKGVKLDDWTTYVKGRKEADA
ncbi:MAG TPA: GH3 auxin-responsive promoter [Cytophagales bacterium]|nr:GH3 auxin-responsive promoter [Cytophagales bacterium]HAA20331.1 GH3 auxin-responsive promoter [Cytophagales bacterium]HAP62904.1 GH3 auxin-responsive promoter [Cytophagales bacterium]